MTTAKRQERTNKQPSKLPADMKQLNNVVHADFTTSKVSKAAQDQISELRINIKDIIDHLKNKDLLEKIHSKAKSMLESELYQDQRTEQLTSIITKKVLNKYYDYKRVFTGSVVLMCINELLFAFGNDAFKLEYLGSPRRLSDLDQTPYFCFHSSDSERIRMIKTSMDATIIM